MHEVSLAGGILRIVEDVARRDAFKRVARICIEAGVLAAVDVGALRFALEAMSPGTVLEGAVIEILRPPGVAFCFGCGESVQIDALGSGCPGCGAYRLQPTQGTELRVLELHVRES
jgi:hydrogenase nickel incorporation protein HypA/HybF